MKDIIALKLKVSSLENELAAATAVVPEAPPGKTKGKKSKATKGHEQLPSLELKDPKLPGDEQSLDDIQCI